METFEPEVNPKAEFAEISMDFGKPLEIFREAISNAFDAKAKNISIEVYTDRSSGIEELIIEIKDDGSGISSDQLKNFFGLGFSSRLTFDSRGNKISGSIGEKGHGTKIYFNSSKVKLKSVRNGILTNAILDRPMQIMRSHSSEMLKVEYDTEQTTENPGTHIKIIGYNNNNPAGFSHSEIKDYILWFTKFGSCENKLGYTEYDDIKCRLIGLGQTVPEVLDFGHVFAPENDNIRNLKQKDNVAPLDYYVAKWCFKDVQVQDFPDSKIDIVFYLEGDKAKREYNPMIHKKNASWAGGVYNVEKRYGLWLCKDFIPVVRCNEWVSEKSEWTKYHAFVNCQTIKLTANRGDAGNTSSTLLDKIRDTVWSIFETSIQSSEKYKRYQEEFERTKQYASSKKEEEDFARRKKMAFQKKAAMFLDFLIFEPRQEGGVFSIVTQLLTLDANVFNFKVIDYDTAFGYDLLVSKNTPVDLNNASMSFVEMKYKLGNDFNHSFKMLNSIICWDTDISEDYELEDIRGEKRVMKITLPTEECKYTKFMLVSNTEGHNIEVFVLRKYLKEQYEIEFVPRAELA